MNTVWLNGEQSAAHEARIDPADRGFTLGDGVFETIRATAGVPDYAEEHLARLRHGARVLGIDIPYSDDVLLDAMTGIADGADCALRMTLTRGPMARGILPVGPARATVLIAASSLPAPLPPARVMIARGTLRNERSPLSRIKSLNYLDSIMARREAHAAGYDDALLLNTRGTLAEASAANIFLLLNERWITPPIEDGALPGLARARLLACGAAAEASIAQDDLAGATAAFLVNSLGIRPVASIDGHRMSRIAET